MEILVVVIILVLFAISALAALGGQARQAAADVRSDLQLRLRPGARRRRSRRKQVCLVLRDAFHLHSVHESDRRHSRLRIAHHDARRCPLGLAVAFSSITTGWVFGSRASASIWLHFAGPMPWLAPLMVPIEFISHLARPLSLTIRLFANMFAGEKVTMTFLSLTFLRVPAVFMGLHVFVAFLQAFIFYAAHHDLCRRSSRARTLMALSVPSVSPSSPRTDWEPPPREQFLYKENTRHDT